MQIFVFLLATVIFLEQTVVCAMANPNAQPSTEQTETVGNYKLAMIIGIDVSGLIVGLLIFFMLKKNKKVKSA